MDNESNPNLNYDLPAEFYTYVKDYLQTDKKIESKEELIALWSHALELAAKYPDDRESIAEWTMSIGAYSPYINDDDIFQALHYGFGSLEVADSTQQTNNNANIEWKRQRELFDTLLSERKHTK